MDDLTDSSVFEQNFLRDVREKKHVLFLYENSCDYRYIASRFIADGLKFHECCVMAVDEYPHEQIIADLNDLGVHAQYHLNKGNLLLINVQEQYSSNAEFDPDKTLFTWQDFISSAYEKNYSNIRIVGEATFSLSDEVLKKKLIYYENLINKNLFPYFPHISLCVYNKKRYSDEVLKAAVQAHPMMVYGKKVYKNNIYFVPPEIFFQQQGTEEIDLWLSNVEASNSHIQQLIENQEQLQQTLEATNDGIWDYNLTTGEFRYSERWATMLGFKQDEVPSFGCFCAENIHPDDREVFEDSFNSYLNGVSEKYELELRLKTKDGAFKWIFTRGKIVQRDKDGKPIRVVGAHTDISERKESEKHLENINTDLKLAQQIAGVGFWKFNPEVGIPEWSDEVYKIYDRDPSFGPPALDDYENIYSGDNFKLFNTSITRAIQNGIPYDILLLLTLQNREEKWIRTICKPEAVKGPKGYKLRGTIQDVSKQKSLERDIFKNEQRFQRLQNCSIDSIYTIDSNGKFVNVNEKACISLGRSKSELLNLTIDDVDANFDREKFIEFWSTIKNDESFLFETKHIRKDGSTFPVEVNGVAFEEDQQRFFYGISRDITERKNAEKRLEESEQMFRMLFDDAPMPYQSLDAEGNFITVNKVFCKTLGYQPDELIGKNFSEFLHPDWAEHFRENFPRFKAIGEILGVEFEMKKKNGEYLLVSFTGKVGKEADGSFRQTHCVFRDITSERSYQEGLVKAKEEAEQASHAKSMFLANMSHELRTPLNGIMGMHQLLKTTHLDDEQKGYVSLAVDSAKRLTNLLSDILDLTRIETGKLNVIENSFDLKETFELAEQLFGPVCRQKGVNIFFEIDSSISKKLIGDQIRVQQIINNLVGNAVKFTESGSIRCEAYPLPHKTKDTQRILFSVSDTGIGIENDKLDQLFEPFTQADEGYKRAYQGAGLGLSIVRQLVSLMGGSIAVASEQGKGTEFHFCLTFKIDTNASYNKRISKSKKIQEPFPHSILIAEDDIVNRTALQAILQKAGYKITSVENGAETLEELAKNTFDLVLMDIQMPIMDGVEATKAIRSGHTGKDNSSIPIVALTAFAMSGDKEIFMDAGMNGYLAKPIDADEVYSIIHQLLNS